MANYHGAPFDKLSMIQKQGFSSPFGSLRVIKNKFINRLYLGFITKNYGISCTSKEMETPDI